MRDKLYVIKRTRCILTVARRLCFAIVLTTLACHSEITKANSIASPNVVVILADDLGYGDVQPLNPSSTVPTPAFERLAAEGITFTDAHTPSAVCTPTRYGLLTGQYCWRTRLKRGVQNGYGKPLIDESRDTIASVLGQAGYRTAIVGKWHLGLGLHGDENNLQLDKQLTHHPGSVGFDHSFVIPASLDFPPYVYFRDGLATTTETSMQTAQAFPEFLRRGPLAADFDMEGCLDRLTDEAVEIVKSMQGAEKPTFLYFPLTAPHKPVMPAERFRGTTRIGSYGDFVRQVDATVGRVLDALTNAKVIDNTIVLVTSDNGSFMYRLEEGETDHVEDETVQGYRIEHHKANADWRGTKADIWEAGHRVPFFVRLPQKKHAGKRIAHTVGLVDTIATLAEMVGAELTESAGPDSFSFASILGDPSTNFLRPPLICHSSGGMFAIRHGNWKLVAGNGSGGRQAPKGKPFAEPWMLIDLEADPAESTNVAEQHSDVFDRLKRQLLEIKGDD